MRRRCFATDGTRLIMPAFGAYAGGLNILDPAFDPILTDPAAYVLGASGVYAFRGPALVADPAPPAAFSARAAG